MSVNSELLLHQVEDDEESAEYSRLASRNGLRVARTCSDCLDPGLRVGLE